MSRKNCRCKKCVSACASRPCWGTPQDAQKLIAAGFADRLMDDRWGAEDMYKDDIHILCPAVVGHESRAAPEASFMHVCAGSNPFGPCTFLTENGLCEVHRFKPTEGRLALLCQDTWDRSRRLHERMAMSWDNDVGRELVKRWRNKTEKRMRRRMS